MSENNIRLGDEVAEFRESVPLEVHKISSSDNPAVHVDDIDVVKSDLEKAQSSNSHGEAGVNKDAEKVERQEDEPKEGAEGKNAETGDKRGQPVDLDGEKQGVEAKKARVDETGQSDKPGKKKRQAKTEAKAKIQATAETTTKKRGPGRPRKSTGTKKEGCS